MEYLASFCFVKLIFFLHANKTECYAKSTCVISLRKFKCIHKGEYRKVFSWISELQKNQYEKKKKSKKIKKL